MLSHSSIPEDPLPLAVYRHLAGLRKEQITLTSNGVCLLWAVGEAGPIIRPLISALVQASLLAEGMRTGSRESFFRQTRVISALYILCHSPGL